MNIFDKYKRNVYAINNGNYVGNLFVCMGKDGDVYNFLSFPNSKIEKVPEKDFEDGLKKGILTFIEKAPRKEFRQLEKLASSLE
jgi:hypothetical protein